MILTNRWPRFLTDLRAGDVVYLTPLEHNPVLRPVEHLRHTVGVEVLGIPFDRQTCACDLDRLTAMFRAGPHYAPWDHRWPGTLAAGGTMRVSVGWFSRVEKMEALLEGVKGVAA